MIARVWNCRVPKERSEAFLQHLLDSGVREVEATPGHRGTTVTTRIEGNVVHVCMTSFWQSYDAIRAFAGEDINRAWLHPDDAAFDLDPDLHVAHHDVVVCRLHPTEE